MHKAWRRLGKILYKPVYLIVTTFFTKTRRVRVVVLVKDEFLVVDGWLSDGQWRLPGGGFRRSEDGFSAAKRELHEELKINLDDKQLKFVKEKDANENGIKFRAFYYLVALSKKPQITSRKIEIMDYKWLNLKEVGDGFLSEQLSEYKLLHK